MKELGRSASMVNKHVESAPARIDVQIVISGTSFGPPLCRKQPLRLYGDTGAADSHKLQRHLFYVTVTLIMILVLVMLEFSIAGTVVRKQELMEGKEHDASNAMFSVVIPCSMLVGIVMGLSCYLVRGAGSTTRAAEDDAA